MLCFQSHLERRGCFSLSPIVTGPLFLSLLQRRAGRSVVPLGGASLSCKGQGQGSRRLFSQKFPLPTTSSLPWGLGRGKQVLTVPAVLGAPGQERRDWRQEEGVVLDKLQVRGERGLAPTWKRCQGRGEAFPYVRETPVLWDLCLLPHRGYVCPLE